MRQVVPGSAIVQEGSDVLIYVWAKPRASRSRVLGLREGRVEVQLAAPPVDGAANSALILFVSKALGVSKSRVQLERGETARSKQLRITEAKANEVEDRLLCDGKLGQ